MSLFPRQSHNAPSANAVPSKEQESLAMEQLLASLLSAELPDAIDLVMLGPSTSDGTEPGFGFACYAARLFADVGASQIRSIAASHDVDIIRLSNTGTFWARFPYMDLSAEELSLVLAAEAAMNRLLFIKEAFDAQTTAQAWSEGDCVLADTSLIFSVSHTAPEHLRGVAVNPLLELFGAQGRKGGEWDVRTRFALAVEALRVPFRLNYAFDCNVSQGLFSIAYTVPPASWMPQHFFDVATNAWVDSEEQATRDAAHYALSLAVLLAATAFGTSVGISRVRVSAHPVRLNADASMTLYVDRLPFIANVVPRLEVRDPSWADELLKVATPVDDGFDKLIMANHKHPTGDATPVPESLREILYADTVGELDVLSDLASDSWDTVHAAEADREESPLAAIAVLENLVDAADKAVENLPANTKALYCSDVVSRFLLHLNKPEAGTRYVRYSDAGFRARSILCDLYCDMGEPDRAIQQAEKCIELAPTSPIGYTDLVNALFSKQSHAEAVPYLEQALSCATQDSTIAFVYYRLAFALWQTGRKEAALAAYVMSSRHNFGRPEVVAQEMQELRAEMGNPAVPDVAMARDILHREGITPAPTPQVRNLVALQLVSLVDNGILDIAAPLARMVGMIEGHRDELFSVGESLSS